MFCDHGFYQLSSDDGRTWGNVRLLKYEDGPDFDPDNWGAPEYFRANEMYIGRTIVLTNGNLLLIMRGSNTGLDPVKYPGRKWFSMSSDGGFTWSEVKDIRYDTGESLYSPASISRTIRSTKSGRLYWMGNIPDVPPDGNSPRYPLQIVEINEEKPSFRKDTLTVIDDRNPEKDSEHLQLSNFSLLENRETYDMEVYLTRLGERGSQPDLWTADAYKYTLVF